MRAKACQKFARKGSVGVSRDGPNFSSTPYYLRNAQSYELQIWQVYSQRLSEQKAFKNLREKGAWVYPGMAEIFPVPRIISGTRRATNFKFGTYIHRVYPSKSLSKIWEKRERWRIQGLLKFFQYSLLSQEWVKLLSSSLAGIFTGSMRTKDT